MSQYLKYTVLIVLLGLLVSCSEKNPPRDEIPQIKKLLGKVEQAVRDKNAAALDSLILAESYDEGYHSTKILADVYPDDTGSFLTFGRREFFYTKDNGVVNCYIVADTADAGRAVEITLAKKYDNWYLKKFDLK